MFTPSVPISSLIRPVATRRVTSICQRRSWAWTTPTAKAASSIEMALTWGTPQRSRPTVTSAARPATPSLPRTRGRDTPKVRWRTTSRAAQRTTTTAATTMRAMIIWSGLGTYYTREPMALRTPLHDRHIAAGARMVEFGGFDMPLQYSTIREEHVAVRTRCGLFDLSHMGEVRFTGDGAFDVVQRLVTNDVARLEVGGALYARDVQRGRRDRRRRGRLPRGRWLHGGDQCRLPEQGRRLDGRSHRRLHLRGRRRFRGAAGGSGSPSGRPRQRALQRRHRLAPTLPLHGQPGGRRGRRRSRAPATRARTASSSTSTPTDAPGLWDALLAAGAPEGLIPCGLGARDTLRLEAGLRLYGQDMDDRTDPYSCALGWTVKLQKGEFIGSAALAGLDPNASAAAVRRHRARRAGRSHAMGNRCSRVARPPARSRAGRTASRSTIRSPRHHWTVTSRRTPNSPLTSEAPSPRQRWCRCPSTAAPREPERGRSLQLPVHRQPRVGPRRGIRRPPSASAITPRRSSAT